MPFLETIVAVALTPAQVRTYAPQFANVTTWPDATIQAIIDDCPLLLSVFGSSDAEQLRAWRLWVCHTLTVQSPDAVGAAGPVVAQAVGRVSVQYGATSLTAGQYSRSSYGQRLQDLIDACCSGTLVA